MIDMKKNKVLHIYKLRLLAYFTNYKVNSFANPTKFTW